MQIVIMRESVTQGLMYNDETIAEVKVSLVGIHQVSIA